MNENLFLWISIIVIIGISYYTSYQTEYFVKQYCTRKKGTMEKRGLPALRELLLLQQQMDDRQRQRMRQHELDEHAFNKDPSDISLFGNGAGNFRTTPANGGLGGNGSPLDCQGSWGECEGECGASGTQRYTITRQASANGQACPTPLTRNCIVVKPCKPHIDSVISGPDSGLYITLSTEVNENFTIYVKINDIIIGNTQGEVNQSEQFTPSDVYIITATGYDKNGNDYDLAELARLNSDQLTVKVFYEYNGVTSQESDPNTIGYPFPIVTTNPDPPLEIIQNTILAEKGKLKFEFVPPEYFGGVEGDMNNLAEFSRYKFTFTGSNGENVILEQVLENNVELPLEKFPTDEEITLTVKGQTISMFNEIELFSEEKVYENTIKLEVGRDCYGEFVWELCETGHSGDCVDDDEVFSGTKRGVYNVRIQAEGRGMACEHEEGHEISEPCVLTCAEIKAAKSLLTLEDTINESKLAYEATLGLTETGCDLTEPEKLELLNEVRTAQNDAVLAYEQQQLETSQTIHELALNDENIECTPTTYDIHAARIQLAAIAPPDIMPDDLIMMHINACLPLPQPEYGSGSSMTEEDVEAYLAKIKGENPYSQLSDEEKIAACGKQVEGSIIHEVIGTPTIVDVNYITRDTIGVNWTLVDNAGSYKVTVNADSHILNTNNATIKHNVPYGNTITVTVQARDYNDNLGGGISTKTIRNLAYLDSGESIVNADGWGNFGECSKECGTGYKTAFCIDPLKGCDAGSSKTEQCNTQPCEQPNVWSRWSNCSKLCGGGTQSRSCLTYDCIGSRSRSCNTHACTTTESDKIAQQTAEYEAQLEKAKQNAEIQRQADLAAQAAAESAERKRLLDAATEQQRIEADAAFQKVQQDIRNRISVAQQTINEGIAENDDAKQYWGNEALKVAQQDLATVIARGW